VLIKNTTCHPNLYLNTTILVQNDHMKYLGLNLISCSNSLINRENNLISIQILSSFDILTEVDEALPFCNKIHCYINQLLF
jgi:hypothetical protein